MGVSKHCSRKREEKRGRGGTYGQATKDTAREEASTSHMGKSAGIL